MNTVVLVVMVVFIEMFLHYFPFRLVLRGRELPRPAAYILGVLGLMVPFTAWLLTNECVEVAVVLWVVIGSGGLAVLALYLLDWIIDLSWGKCESEARERALLEQRDGKG